MYKYRDPPPPTLNLKKKKKKIKTHSFPPQWGPRQQSKYADS